MDKEKFLTFKIFNGFNPEQLEKVVSLGKEISCKKNDVVLEEATPGLNLYLLLSGRVAVELKNNRLDNLDAEISNLAVLREGAVFGEITFLEEKRRSARIIALDDISCLELDKNQLYDLFEKDARIGYMIMRNIATILSQRLVNLNFRLRDNI
jgi:CRP-like cAMP-binding protein